MVMIQDGPQNTGADKPLRISGDPFKVQVSTLNFKPLHCYMEVIILWTNLLWTNYFKLLGLYSKPKIW